MAMRKTEPCPYIAIPGPLPSHARLSYCRTALPTGLALIAATLACLSTLPARADIYILQDDENSMHLSNIPGEPGYRTLLRESPADAVAGEAEAGKADWTRFKPLVAEAAREYGVKAALLYAVMAAESSFNPAALSPKGAAGLMQLMPDTARRYGVQDRHDPAQSIRGAAQYLRDLLRLFKSDLRLTLAAYNAGENAVIRHGNRIPPYRETLRYVPKVLLLYDRFLADPDLP